jgi:hypothetical protein
MPRSQKSGRFMLSLVVLVLLGLGVMAWLERGTLLAWYHVRQLLQAGDANREARAQCVAELGDAAIPGLLDGLKEQDPVVCANVRAGLSLLARAGGGLSESRAAELVGRLAKDFGHLSRPGQHQVLEMTGEWFQTDPAAAAMPGLMSACGRLLAAALGASDSEVQSAGLQLCRALLSQPQGAEVLATGRELARAYLLAGDAEVRVKAIQMALHPGMDLLESVAGLLHDPAVEVRRAALIAVGPAGPADKVVLDEILLPCLRDPDSEVRQLCAAALRGRGLGPEDVELARLLTDPQPLQRMRCLEHLGGPRNLDPAVWLRRLSQDPDPSVRAAASRIMGEQKNVELIERLEQMAHNDPSPTVRYLAGYWLRQARQLQAEADGEMVP